MITLFTLLQKCKTAARLLADSQGREVLRIKIRAILWRSVPKRIYPDYYALKNFTGEYWLLPTQNRASEWMFCRPRFDQLGMRGCLDLIEPGEHVLDLGANHGFYSILFARKVGPQGGVTSIEAFPDTIPVLKKQLSEMPQCRIIQAPLWSRIIDINLDFNPEIPDAERSISTSGVATCKSTTVDQIWSDLGKPALALVKIDVEGCELAVLNGGLSLWNCDSPPWLYIEVHPHALERFHATAEKLVDQLLGFGYELFLPGEEPRGAERIVELAKLRTYINVFAKPQRGIFCSRAPRPHSIASPSPSS